MVRLHVESPSYDIAAQIFINKRMSTQPSQVSNQPPSRRSKRGKAYRISRSEHSGFVIVCFRPGAVDPRKKTLLSAARATGFLRLVKLLQRLELDGAPLITAVNADDLLELENAAAKTNFPPIRSLTQYWRVDARRYTAALDDLQLSCHHWLKLTSFTERRIRGSRGRGVHAPRGLLQVFTRGTVRNRRPVVLGGISRNRR